METNKFENKELPPPNYDVYVFDMDGTIYVLGENGSFVGSLLQKKVLEKTAQLLQRYESLTPQDAADRVNQIIASGNQLSLYFQNTYGLSVSEYFQLTWDHNPAEIVSQFEDACTTVRELKNNGKKIYLLTGAPKVWQENVIKFLNLDPCFENIYTVEDYRDKTDGFKHIKLMCPNQSIISIGDQIKTDIETALSVGINAMHITHPSQLLKLIK